ncbi:MAG: hypothetical protein COW84_06635 [Gammaproteobacteria bacterium CG22_combo_CG10-13_8_21_14_all_40_8]|nr:MAG: hypothetical protein COW84_06635 [Gammaproteobacteria bacterium CG22_combo_CG10-13_8_21_14_all_40_8]
MGVRPSKVNNSSGWKSYSGKVQHKQMQNKQNKWQKLVCHYRGEIPLLGKNASWDTHFFF